MSFGIIFDMDGTLIDNMPAAWRAINRGLIKYGFQVPDHEIKLYAGRPFEQKVITWKEKYGVEVDLNYLIPLYEKYEREELERKPVNQKGLINLLDELQSHHTPMGIATSTNPARAEHNLKLFKLRDYFQAVVTMKGISHPKPHPEMFLTAAARIGVDPKQCIVIEDAPSGLKAGRAAGMKTIALLNPYLPEEESQKADLQISSFSELSYTILNKLLKKKH